MDKNIGLSAGIIALLALAAHVAVPTGGEQKAADQTAPAGNSKKNKAAPAGASPEARYEGPWLATRHFFMPANPPPPVRDAALHPVDIMHRGDILRCANDPVCQSNLRQFFGVADAAPVDCLLAIVPDPRHTRLALFTDRSIDGLLKGAAAAGWEFATQWLPWTDTVDPDEGDPEERAQQRSYVRVQETQPGVLVFRRSANSPNWGIGGLVVFVVGETPIAGVNPTQFQNARAYMKALCTPGEAGDQVKIAGPTFSGSLDSLAFLIRHDLVKQPGTKYKIRSGTVQSPNDARHLMYRFQDEVDFVDFHSATADFSEEDRHFRDVLLELGIKKSQAAVLVEDESTFGKAAADSAVEYKQLPNGKVSASRIRTFQYPRDISHLRDAYHQAQQTAKPEGAPAPGLDFSLKDPTVGEDSVPTFSQTQTPLSQNGVVNEIARAIRRFDIRIVEVYATNVLDALFLAAALRQQCPDTRILFQSADLLFVQAGQTEPLGGALFLASYPLFAESRAWAGQIDLTFPDTLSQGVFNATVLLLGDPNRLQDQLADYAWESSAAPYPPEWLLTLDRRGFTPVKVWDNSGTTSWFKPAGGGKPITSQDWFESVPGANTPRTFANLTPPPIWVLLSSAFACLGVVVGTWMVGLSRKPDWQADARFEPSDSKDSWHGFYLLMFLLLLLAIQLGIFAARWFPDDPPYLHQITMAIGFLLPALAAVLYCRPGKKQRLAACLAAAVVLSAVAVWGFCCLQPGAEGQLFSFRSAELRFGSSPLWPIVSAAAALLLWCFVHVTRLYLASRGQPDVVTDGVEVLKGHLKGSYDDFWTSANSALGISPGQRPWFWIALLVSGALCVLSRADIQFASIDGWPYNALSITLPLLVAGLLLLTCWHIHCLWKSLHCFTTNLDLLPVARAFIRVSPAGGNRPIWVRRSDVLSLEVHTSSVMVLHDLKLHREKVANHGLSPSSVGSWHALYGAGLASLFSVNPSRTRRTLVGEHQNIWHLSKVIATVICKLTLAPAWRTEPLAQKMGAAAAARTEGQSPSEEDAPAPARRPVSTATASLDSVLDLAERFVALHYTPFLIYGVRQIQNLLWFPSIGFVLLMFAMNSYNFQAPHWIGTFLLLVFVVITWTLGRCMIQMERDPILSRIAGTKPGQLGAMFYLKLALYGALPVLGLLARQFPAISNTLLSGIQPALEALK